MAIEDFGEGVGMRKSRRLLWVVLGVVLCGGVSGGVWWAMEEMDRTPKNFGVVEAGRLFRSGTLTPESMRYAVEELGVERIVDFGGTKLGSEEFARVYAEAERLGVEVFRLGMHGDGRGDPNNYVEALKIMEGASAEAPVLVHCAAGAERTGVCVLLYRTILEDWDVEKAYREAKGYGTDPGDNWRFMAYVAEWGDEIEKSFREGGTIEGHGFRDLGRLEVGGSQGVSGVERVDKEE